MNDDQLGRMAQDVADLKRELKSERAYTQILGKEVEQVHRCLDDVLRHLSTVQKSVSERP